jgi:hypothetical protein
MKNLYCLQGFLFTCAILLTTCNYSSAQVDTTFIYKTGTPFGTLDLRIRKSATRFYYLKEDQTFSYRQNGGVRTNTFRDMTSWDSSPYRQGNLREKNGSADYFILNYRLLFPSSYKTTYSAGYPLIVMMHGAGERGNCWNNNCYHDDRSWNPNSNNPAAPSDASLELLNNDHNLLHGGKPHLDARNLAGSKLPDDPTLSSKAFPGFVLFPQNLNGWNGGTVQDAIRLIRLLVNKYNIDPDRIYIHGLSNGGIAVYEAIKRAPWLFAAALPMSSPGEAGIISKNLISSVAHIPQWVFQGGMDKAPTPSKTEGYIKKFRDAGAVVRYSLYSNLGHGVWNTAYKEADFFSWMLNQRKNNIHVFGGDPTLCSTNSHGVRMEVAKGFRKYQWSKNGVVISGATTASYEAKSTGSYRVRFSRVVNPSSSEWNEWSEPVNVTQYTPPQPVIEQIGTVKLKDLNYYNYGRLKSATEADKYYWYKDNVLVNLSGSQDDTVSHPRFSAGNCSTGTCTGNGKYHLVTATQSGCRSVPSKSVNIYFSNQAPIAINAPGNFAGKSNSVSTVKLSWSDLSTNESGFEVWRRTVLGSSSYSKWEMRTITTANVKLFYDEVSPSTTYHYKLRAVNTTFRSNYTPAANNAYLVVNTSGDNINPSTPQTLTASMIGIGSIKLTWKASTDNTGIKQYRIYYDGKTQLTNSTATSYTIKDLPINESYSFTVKAEDLGGNLSAASNSSSANTYVNGLYYEHSTGAWQDIDQIDWNATPEFTGHVSTFTIGPKTQADYFNFKFDGYLYIKKAGTYQFRTISSDGSRLELENSVVVNNDGLHGTRTFTGPTISVASGPRKIVAKYFEYDGVENLTVQYKGPDTNYGWITIPASALTSGSPTSTMMASMNTAEMTEITTIDTQVFFANVYPNPTTSDNITVQLETSDQTTPVVVRFMNFTGHALFENTFYPEQLSEGLTIKSSTSLENGVYLMLIRQGNEISQNRISIQN